MEEEYCAKKQKHKRNIKATADDARWCADKNKTEIKDQH